MLSNGKSKSFWRRIQKDRITTAGYFNYSALQFITALRDLLLTSGLDRFAVPASDAEV